MDLFKHVLVVSWLTKHCNKTIQFGISLSRKYKAELSVIHVMDTTWLKGWSIPMVSVEQEHKRDMEMRKAELHEIISAEKKKGMEIKEYVREGTPSKVILKLIKEEHIDLLILRSHEENRLERMLVGGSNDEIIRAMPCSIFLVKQEVCDME
ncbi:MAG: universal stress protein [Deltaproteobacteria bacterium HGW-Deltaproteobacteria-13]|jgi:nucleotide-binding universal stress UspA family protein|nr:MAG: universal stress protein [Deltaproteobacteria bacterium HGW-Deltaproteobacteria-13]